MSQPFLPGTPPEEIERGYKALSDRIRKMGEKHEKFLEDHGPCFDCNARGLVSHWDCPRGFICENCKGSGWATNEDNKKAREAFEKHFEAMDRIYKKNYDKTCGDCSIGLIECRYIPDISLDSCKYCAKKGAIVGWTEPACEDDFVQGGD